MPTAIKSRRDPRSYRRSPNKALIKLRIDCGLSPNELAYRAEISGKTVRMAEAGFLPSPRIQHAIASVFERKPTDIWPLHTQVDH